MAEADVRAALTTLSKPGSTLSVSGSPEEWAALSRISAALDTGARGERADSHVLRLGNMEREVGNICGCRAWREETGGVTSIRVRPCNDALRAEVAERALATERARAIEECIQAAKTIMAKYTERMTVANQKGTDAWAFQARIESDCEDAAQECVDAIRALLPPATPERGEGPGA